MKLYSPSMVELNERKYEQRAMSTNGSRQLQHRLVKSHQSNCYVTTVIWVVILSVSFVHCMSMNSQVNSQVTEVT